jgi:ABC-type polysaccharide/polyol phosphate export permease
MFNFFNAITTFATKAIAINAGFIKSLKIKTEAFVFSGVLQFVFSHLFELLVLVVFAIFFKVNISWIIFYPIIFFFFVLFTTGISLILSIGATETCGMCGLFLPVYYGLLRLFFI